MGKYKLLFIQPKSDVLLNINPPLGLLTLASLTPPKFDFKLVDENIEKLNFEKSDIVAITVQSFLVKRAYEIADTYKKMGSKVILGGIHVSFLPEEAIKHADSVVIGEADSVWREILKDFSNGKLNKYYKCYKPNLSDLPIINWDLVQGKNYFNKYVLQTSRGCPYGCDFCSVSLFNGIKIRHRPIKDIINEIKNIKSKVRYKPGIFFVDDNIIADKEYAKRLFMAMIPLKIRWYGQSSINMAEDDGLLDLATKSGCRWLFIGFESLNQNSLREVHKPFMVEKYVGAIKKIRKRGILIQASFIFGFDSDDKHTFEKVVSFCDKNKLDFVAFHPLTCFPGTKLFRRLKIENRLVGDYGIKFKNMSQEELIKGMMKAYLDFYSIPLILKRTVRFLLMHIKPTSVIRYLGLNIVMRNAVRNMCEVES